MGPETAPAPPATFTALKNLVRIHLKQILTLDKKPPMYAVALLAVIAFEALGKFLHPRRGPEYLFAQEHERRRGVPAAIGAVIFDVLRNGLAHRYGPYPVLVEALGAVRLQLTWKDGAAFHFGGIAVRLVDGHQQFSTFPAGTTITPQDLCINVETLWHDLDGVFAACEMRLIADAALAARFEGNVRRNLEESSRSVDGDAARAWREFLVARRMDQTQ